jgi:hypothetical protein
VNPHGREKQQYTGEDILKALELGGEKKVVSRLKGGKVGGAVKADFKYLLEKKCDLSLTYDDLYLLELLTGVLTTDYPHRRQVTTKAQEKYMANLRQALERTVDRRYTKDESDGQNTGYTYLLFRCIVKILPYVYLTLLSDEALDSIESKHTSGMSVIL